VLIDEFVAGFLGLVPAHLPQSCSHLQCVRASSAVAVLSVGAIYELKTNISRGSYYCSDVLKACLDHDHFIANFLLIASVKEL